MIHCTYCSSNLHSSNQCYDRPLITERPSPVVYNAVKVEVEFRFATKTHDNGTGAISRTYVNQSYDFAVADILKIISRDYSLDAADILRVTAEPRRVEQ